MYACNCIIHYIIVYLLQCDVFSPGLTVRMLSCDLLVPSLAGPTSALWNIRSPSCARNVMFTEKPSAAPQPSFLSVCCACTKFFTPRSARVKKYRAAKHEYTIFFYTGWMMRKNPFNIKSFFPQSSYISYHYKSINDFRKTALEVCLIQEIRDFQDRR